MITEYEKEIKELARGPKNEVFYNSSEQHAVVVFKSLFENARNYVHTICGDFCGELSSNPEFIGNVKNFLAGDTQREFHLLFDAYNPKFLNTELGKLLLSNTNQVKLRKFKGNGYLQFKDKRAHLTVSDNRAYRLETNVVDKMAFGNFNDEEKTKIFDDVFKLYFYSDFYSEPIIINDAA